MSYKVEATNKLKTWGVLVPPSFTISKKEYPQLKEYLATFPDVDYWYLRATRTEEVILPRRVVTSSELGEVLSVSLRANPDAQIVVQERVDVAYSGVLVRTSEFIYVEYVKGGLQSLLRDGVTPCRVALNSSGRILISQENEQEFWYRWEKDNLIKEPAVKPASLPDSTFNTLLETAHLSTNATTLEWLQDRKDRVFFIDIKSVPEEFLSGKHYLLRGFELGTFVTLDLPLGDAKVRNIGEREEGVFLIERPLYNYMDDILQHASAVVSKGGGVLSHLIVYATKKGIPCVISDSYYNKCFAEKEINISPAALLTNINN